jgi:hypothetical protein
MRHSRSPGTGWVTGRALVLVALANGGCTSLLGDFTSSASSSDANSLGTVPEAATNDDTGSSPPPAPEASTPTDGSSGSGSSDGSSGSGSSDAGPEAQPPPPPGQPAFDMVAGGAVSTSANYVLIGTVGESPGVVVGTSPSYKLRGGVVGATQ